MKIEVLKKFARISNVDFEKTLSFLGYMELGDKREQIMREHFSEDEVNEMIENFGEHDLFSRYEACASNDLISQFRYFIYRLFPHKVNEQEDEIQ